MTLSQTERELLDASQEIGGICEIAAWYTDGLANTTIGSTKY